MIIQVSVALVTGVGNRRRWDIRNGKVADLAQVNLLPSYTVLPKAVHELSLFSPLVHGVHAISQPFVQLVY